MYDVLNTPVSQIVQDEPIYDLYYRADDLVGEARSRWQHPDPLCEVECVLCGKLYEAGIIEHHAANDH